MKKKVYTLLLMLTLALIFVLIPASVFADTNGFAGGDGSVDNPYQITDKYELDNMRNYPDANFILMNDIVFEDEDFEEGGDFYEYVLETNDEIGNPKFVILKGWEPVLDFAGRFNGNGKEIIGLQGESYYSDRTHLFEWICENALIEDVILKVDSPVNLTRVNRGTIARCFVSGNVAAKGDFSAICESNFGRIAECVSNVNVFSADNDDVESSKHIAGICIWNGEKGIIEDCLNLGMFFSLGRNTSGICVSNGVNIASKAGVRNCLNCMGLGSMNSCVGDNFNDDNITDALYYIDFSGQGNSKLATSIKVEELNKPETFEGFDFTNTWKINDANAFPVPKNNPGAQKYLNGVATLTAKVKNFQAEAYSYKSVKLSWDKTENASKYIIYRLDGKCIEIDGNKVSYIDKDMKANSKSRYQYIIVPVLKYNGMDITNAGKGFASSGVVDMNSDNDSEDYTCPILNEIEVLSEETYLPGTIDIKLSAKDLDSGISSIMLVFNPRGTAILAEEESDADDIKVIIECKNKSNIDGIIHVPVGSDSQKGIYQLSGISIKDAAGNENAINKGTLLSGRKIKIRDEFDIEFTGVLSNTSVPRELKNMDPGKTVVLKINEKSKGILKKEILDAIKGQDKTVVVYADSQGSMQWVFYGKDITGTTKDLDLNVKVKKVDGSDYGGKGSIVHLTYANNGKLPGLINFRLKSDYINAINGLDDELYLYHLNGKKVELERSDCQVIKDGNSHWCYFELEHNSEFLLSGKELKHPLEKQTAKLSYTSTTYSGSAKKPTVTIKGLKKDTDYTVSYKNNTNAGKATVTIKGKGNYAGTITKTFTIKAKKITAASLGTTSYVYNGEAKKPAVTVKSGDKVLMKAKKEDNASVDLTYATGRKNPGTYKVTIKGKGNYTGTITKKFTVKMKGTSLKNVTKGKKQFTATWKKVPASNITGYQIRYSTTKNFAKYTDVKIKKNTTVSKTVKVKKGGQKYWVKVRTYKVIGNKSYYSTWSESKTVTPKK